MKNETIRIEDHHCWNKRHDVSITLWASSGMNVVDKHSYLMKLTVWAKRVFYFDNDGLLYVLSYSSYTLSATQPLGCEPNIDESTNRSRFLARPRAFVLECWPLRVTERQWPPARLDSTRVLFRTGRLETNGWRSNSRDVDDIVFWSDTAHCVHGQYPRDKVMKTPADYLFIHPLM